MSVLLLLFFRKVLPPACHLERSPPEIPPSLCSVLLRSSTTLRFAQNDTADAVETRRANAMPFGSRREIKTCFIAGTPRGAFLLEIAADINGKLFFKVDKALGDVL